MPDMPLSHITITRTLTDDDDLIEYQLSDGMTVIEAVGLMTMTIDSILANGIDNDDGDEADEDDDGEADDEAN